MIVVDSSAIVAIFRTEPEAEGFGAIITADSTARMSAASVLECSIVIRSLKRLSGDQSEEWLDRMLLAASIVVEPLDLAQLAIARLAHGRYGKGTGHPAQLNFGDCFAYALAKSLGAPLLYKGGDFSKTDIESAL